MERRRRRKDARGDGSIDDFDLPFIHGPLLVADFFSRQGFEHTGEQVELDDEAFASRSAHGDLPDLQVLLHDCIDGPFSFSTTLGSLLLRLRGREGEDARARVDRLGAKDGRPDRAGPPEGALEHADREVCATRHRDNVDRDDARLRSRQEVRGRREEDQVADEFARVQRRRRRLEAVDAREGEADLVPEGDFARVGDDEEARFALALLLARLRRRRDERGERERRKDLDVGGQGRLRRQRESVRGRRWCALQTGVQQKKPLLWETRGKTHAGGVPDVAPLVADEESKARDRIERALDWSRVGICSRRAFGGVSKDSQC